jgi:molybdopterin converting factor small subunit
MADTTQEKAETRTIRFAEVGNRKGVVEVDLGPDETLKDLLAKQGVAADREVRVNNDLASEGTELKEGDLIMALPRVVGG